MRSVRSLSYVCLLLLIAAPVTGASFPSIIPLPLGFAPEGIAVGHGTEFFVGSLVTGEIYKGDLRTGSGAVLVQPSPPRLAVGLALDQRSNFLFVASAFFGQAHVYDARTGADVGVFQLTTALDAFVNDVVVTRQAAYFTDSWRPVLYRLPLGPGGRLPGPTAAEEIPLTGDYLHLPPDAVNANGIDATPNGEWLLVINWSTGLLYRVDPLTGYAMLVDLGGETLPSGDGILLDGGHTLYVVQSFLNQIAVVDLDPSLLTGAVVDTIANPDFRIPSTAAELGNRLYLVNARFDVAPPGDPAPGVEFEVVGVQKP
jgi:sugar lactone lactonase YvrE